MFTRLLIGGIICTPIVIAAATHTNSQAERERNPEITTGVSGAGAHDLALNPPTVTLVGPSSKNVFANSQNNEAMFFVENNNATSQNYTLTCGRTSAVTACTPVPSSISLDGYEQIDVSVLYNVGSSGTGMVWLVAGGKRDTLNVTVVPSDTAGAPIVDVANVNPGTLLDRSSCVTSAAGAVGAFQCGELLLAHSMPAFKSLNRDRTFTLLYNSATARVHPVIMADISLGAGILTPDSVKATVTIGGINRVTRWFSAASLSASARRIALGFDAAAAGFATGVQVYTLEVSNYYGSTPKPAQVTGDLIVINRRASPYGAGWAPAGVEQLFPGQRNGAVLLVGGDGSAAVYEGIATNTWLAPVGAFRDTLWYDGSSYYRRELDKTTIFYNGSGLQTRVADRIGNEVQYTYRSSSDPGLLSVKIAPLAANKQYLMSYDAYSRIAYITDPANRVLGLTVNTSGDLTHARDPGFTTDIVMGYDADHRLKTWTSRRGGRSSFVYYDATALLVRDTLPAPASSPGIRTFTAAQTRGYGASASGLNSTVSAATVTTYIDGPRADTDSADVATFYLNRYGAPTRIVNAYSHQTSIRYSATHPLLADSIMFPNGRTLRFTYDASARTTKSEDLTHSSGTAAVVDYSYLANSPAPERPDTVKLPSNGSQRDVIRFVHDSTGTKEIFDARGYRTTFRKNSFGQDTAVVQHGVAVWNGGSIVTDSLVSIVQYDNLGNPYVTKTPLGHLTQLRRDSAGNVIRVKAPASDSIGYRYTSMNWQDRIIQYGAAGIDSTKLTFDDDGNRTVHCDARGICRSWTFDHMGRVLTMADEKNFSEEHRYDAAGNPVYFRDRNGDTVTSIYDRLNRVTRKLIGQVLTNTQIEKDSMYGGWINRIVTPADTQTFSYDVLGRLSRAETNSSVIKREYTLEGALQRDSQYIKAPISTSFVGQYSYQPSGVRATYSTPAQTYTYTYSAGAMLDQISWSGGAATFSWDALGRRDTVLLTNGHETIHQYDADGRIRRAKSKFGSTTVFDRQYEAYDSAGRVLQFDDTGDRFGAGHSRRYMVYDGRGQLRKELTDNGASVGSIIEYDAVGNRTRVASRCSSWLSCPDTTDYTYYSGTNRVDSTRLRRFGNPIVTRHKYFYDRNGATTADRSSDDPSYTTYNYRYYDAAGRLLAGYYAATHDTVPTGMPSATAANVFYAYDATGRKVRGASPSNSGAWMFYDGENTVRLMTHEFLHGPGLDEPLVAFFSAGSGIGCDDSYSAAYFVTVGNRLLDYHSGGTGLSCFGNSQGQYPAWTTVGQHSGAIKDSEGPGLSRSAGNTSPNDASLSFFRNRWYDSNTGRFTQEDPIGFGGGLNLYAYAGNNPAGYTDPFGLDCKDAKGNRVPCPPLLGKLRLAETHDGSTRGSGYVVRTRRNGERYQHQGVDLAATPGSPVFAMYDGVVAKNSSTGGAEGLSVIVKSENAPGESSSYWHLSESWVAVGERVKGGQQIGTSGTSGNGDPGLSGREAHLHVRKQVNGADVNPKLPGGN